MGRATRPRFAFSTQKTVPCTRGSSAMSPLVSAPVRPCGWCVCGMRGECKRGRGTRVEARERRNKKTHVKHSREQQPVNRCTGALQLPRRLTHNAHNRLKCMALSRGSSRPCSTVSAAETKQDYAKDTMLTQTRAATPASDVPCVGHHPWRQPRAAGRILWCRNCGDALT